MRTLTPSGAKSLGRNSSSTTPPARAATFWKSRSMQKLQRLILDPFDDRDAQAQHRRDGADQPDFDRVYKSSQLKLRGREIGFCYQIRQDKAVYGFGERLGLGPLAPGLLQMLGVSQRIDGHALNTRRRWSGVRCK